MNPGCTVDAQALLSAQGSCRHDRDFCQAGTLRAEIAQQDLIDITSWQTPNIQSPFSRVVRAAVEARRRKTSFGVGDVAPDLLVPEVHVLAIARKGCPDETMVASVQSIVLVRRTEGSENVVQPLRTAELSPQGRSLTASRPVMPE
jgi:hypothetical protein